MNSTFDEYDSGEKTLGRVSDMDGDALLRYMSHMHKELFGFRMPVNLHRDRAILKQLVRYHRSDAGKIVKWFIHEHGGKFQGETLTPQLFTATRNWWIDVLFREMQTRTAEYKAKMADVPLGAMSVDEFLSL